jgi:tetratricopeptide (TPR) repeat protein
MFYEKNQVFRIAIVGILLFVSTLINAQTLNEVINVFNAGADEVNAGNFEAAIAKFEECIRMANELGAEGDEVKARAQEQIPTIHYRIALDTYKEKDIGGAISWFEKTVEACDKYGNEDIKEKSLNYIPQLYYAQGSTQFRNEEIEEALESFNKAIEYKPDYSRAFLGKGLVYKKMEQEENMFSALDQAIETGNSSGDDQTAAAAAKTARDYLVVEGMKALKAEDYSSAIDFFNASFKYDDQYADPYYYLAAIYNKQLEYEKAAENAQKALEHDDNEPEKKARIYYELGNAYVGLVEYEKACEAYTNALYEPYTNVAKHKMENVPGCQPQ